MAGCEDYEMERRMGARDEPMPTSPLKRSFAMLEKLAVASC
jgi:hypothetical protein